MGSDSDLPVVEKAVKLLRELEIPFEAHVYSAHRTPEEARDFAVSARAKGFGVIIAAAGMAAHLAGAIAANTTLPVIGIPCKGPALDGLDALLSTVQMPSGIPVATVGIGTARRTPPCWPPRSSPWRTPRSPKGSPQSAPLTREAVLRKGRRHRRATVRTRCNNKHYK